MMASNPNRIGLRRNQGFGQPRSSRSGRSRPSQISREREHAESSMTTSRSLRRFDAALADELKRPRGSRNVREGQRPGGKQPPPDRKQHDRYPAQRSPRQNSQRSPGHEVVPRELRRRRTDVAARPYAAGREDHSVDRAPSTRRRTLDSARRRENVLRGRTADRGGRSVQRSHHERRWRCRKRLAEVQLLPIGAKEMTSQAPHGSDPPPGHGSLQALSIETAREIQQSIVDASSARDSNAAT